MKSIFQINKILILVLLSLGLVSPSLAALFDDWTDNQLCEWMDQPSPPEIIESLVSKRLIICSKGIAKQLSASEFKEYKLVEEAESASESKEYKLVEEAESFDKVKSELLSIIEVSDAFDGSFSFNFTGVDEGGVLGFGYGTLNIKNGVASVSKDSQGMAKPKYQSFEGRVDKNGYLTATLIFNPCPHCADMVDKLIVFEGNLDKKKLSGMYDDIKLYFYLVKK
jgi:hypothetical protein